MPSSYTPSGSSSPQLPAWTYTDGSIGSQLFITDNDSIALTTDITLSAESAGPQTYLANTAAGSIIYFVDSSGNTSSFLLVGASNGGSNNTRLSVTYFFGSGNWSGKYTYSVAPLPQTKAQVGLGDVPNVDATNAGNIASGTLAAARGGAGAANGILKADGAGAVSAAAAGTDYVAPGGAGTMVADSGWTGNADNGDKTSVIGSTATLDTIATALNIVTAGAGTQLENIAQKVKALEAALVTFKVPNA